MMKTANGLSEEFLRFDAASFIAKALEGHITETRSEIAYASHPPLALRARALFWFEEYRVRYFPRQDTEALTAFKKLDERVARDMDKYVERGVHRLQSEAALELNKWIWTASAISKDRFDAKSQAIIAKEFGETFCGKVKSILATLSEKAAYDWVYTNAAEAFSTFQSMFPRGARDEADSVLEKSEKVLLGPGTKCFLRSRDWPKPTVC
jgi:hypothetical protein